MFKTVRLFKSQIIDRDSLLESIEDIGYKWQDPVQQEGDFSFKGDVVDMFPITFEFPLRVEFDLDSINTIYSFNPFTGRRSWEHQMVILLPFREKKTKILPVGEEIPVVNLLDISVGDYVVHTKYGIGIYRGIQTLDHPKKGIRQHLIIEYAKKDKLFLPIENAHLVQKYLGFGARPPLIYRLGSKRWEITKAKVKQGIRDYALEMLRLYSMRSNSEGYAFSKDVPWQKDFEKTFPYKETEGQLQATKDVKRDMDRPVPMDRLLCGDVGYGKTEVAMRAAFKAVMDGKQVAFLVPTTILAQQHIFTFSQRLKDFPVEVQMLSRFQTDAEQKDIINRVRDGKTNILIGTHRMLSSDVIFKDLGLVIIDEEHLFGVKAKERFKQIRINVDTLTMTATPIPRTLYLALMTARDLSVIATAPLKREPVKTFISVISKELIRQVIKKEMDRGGQVYFVNDKIEDIEDIFKYLKSVLPSSIKLGIAHGRIHPNELKATMKAFLEKQIDCLVSTTIIQSGIDIPNVNTIIINNANRFGLASLHQLRGRVGRFERKAYAYMFVPSKKKLSIRAQRRLKAVEKFSDLGAGFEIAMQDLQIRGAGNLLGIEQHGFITTVGFDLYCRLLRTYMEQLKEKII